jgi:alkanesulfonate monooxygenase SsuD/methylene tetrahydromethanopterin reductase-like flavin-dependent oxidoreductase (luciferase family)
MSCQDKARTMEKKLGFLSFGHYQPIRGSLAHTAEDALSQAIDLAVGAEEIGLNGAWIRVHHYQQQFSSPWPLLAAMAARTTRLELGTGIIDMRYENPLNMAELAASTDLISGRRLQLGISRGSQEPALRGYEAFGYIPERGQDHGAMARAHTEKFRAAIAGAAVVESDPAETGSSYGLQIEPRSEDLPRRVWWGSSTRASAQWAAEQGMNLMSSTLLSEDTGDPFHELQAAQIQIYRDRWAEMGHAFTPRVSVARGEDLRVQICRVHLGHGRVERDCYCAAPKP